MDTFECDKREGEWAVGRSLSEFACRVVADKYKELDRAVRDDYDIRTGVPICVKNYSYDVRGNKN